MSNLNPSSPISQTVIDRLTRSVRDLLDLLDLFALHKVRLVSITESLDTDTPVGRMVITILAAVAQMEREQTGERCRMAAAHAKANARPWGTVPWGFRRNRNKLVRYEPEIAAVRRAVKLRADGMTYLAIAESLTREGYKPRPRKKPGTRSAAKLPNTVQPKRWRPQSIHRLLTAATNLGIPTPKHVEPITSTKKGYRTDGPAHRKSRMKVTALRRKEIGKLGAMGRERKRGSGK
jgi:hypothetical protein